MTKKFPIPDFYFLFSSDFYTEAVCAMSSGKLRICMINARKFSIISCLVFKEFLLHHFVLASSHTTLVTSVSHNFWVYLYYYAMHEFCFSSFSHQVASTKWVENMKNLPHLFVCLTLKVIDLLGNPVVDSRITTHYPVFPFFSPLCIISGKHQQKFSQAWTLPFAFVIHR